MTRSRFDTPGGAAKCTLAASMDNSQTTFTINGDVSNWPTGAGSHHFCVILERGTSRMEKLECTALSGSSPATLTIATRGYDGSTAQAHANGVPAEVGFGGLYLSEHEAHLFDTTRDDHTQYLKTDGTRAFTGVSAIAAAPTSVGTANAAGSALTLARSDHVHALGAGSVNSSSVIAAGAIAGTNLAVGAVGVTQLGTGSVVATTIGTNVIVSTNITTGGVVATTIGTNVITTGQLAVTTMPIISVTSTTHPTTTTIGNAIVETDTWNLKQYTTSTTGYQPPWNLPWGEVCYVQRTTAPADTTNTEGDLVTAITFTAVANRIYEFTWHCPLMVPSNTVDGEYLKVKLTDNANTMVMLMGQKGFAAVATVGSDSQRTTADWRVRLTTVSAGSQTYKVRGVLSSATGAVQYSASATTDPGPMWVSVRDLGPSTTPA